MSFGFGCFFLSILFSLYARALAHLTYLLPFALDLLQLRYIFRIFPHTSTKSMQMQIFICSVGSFLLASFSLFLSLFFFESVVHCLLMFESRATKSLFTYLVQIQKRHTHADPSTGLTARNENYNNSAE